MGAALALSSWKLLMLGAGSTLSRSSILLISEEKDIQWI